MFFSTASFTFMCIVNLTKGKSGHGNYTRSCMYHIQGRASQSLAAQTCWLFLGRHSQSLWFKLIINYLRIYLGIRGRKWLIVGEESVAKHLYLTPSNWVGHQTSPTSHTSATTHILRNFSRIRGVLGTITLVAYEWIHRFWTHIYQTPGVILSHSESSTVTMYI